jgi:hypothetical protein
LFVIPLKLLVANCPTAKTLIGNNSQILSSLLETEYLLFKNNLSSEKRLSVDLGDLPSEKENLQNFIQLHLKISTLLEADQDKIILDSEKVSVGELEHVVNKFIYHRDLNMTHYVSAEGETVKINRFKEQPKKKEKHEKEPPHQTAAQSWGL